MRSWLQHCPHELFPWSIRGKGSPSSISGLLTRGYQYHQSVIDNTRQAEEDMEGRPVAIALDTKGPEIRTGNTKGDADIPIAMGAEINITTDDKYKTECDDKNM